MATITTATNFILTYHLLYVGHLKIVLCTFSDSSFPLTHFYLRQAAAINHKLNCFCPLLKIIQWFYFSLRIKVVSSFQWSSQPYLVFSSLYHLPCPRPPWAHPLIHSSSLTVLLTQPSLAST